jgi:hypothetical protein
MQSRAIKNSERNKEATKADKNSASSRNSFPIKDGKQKEYDGKRCSRTHFSTACIQDALNAQTYSEQLIASQVEEPQTPFSVVLEELVSVVKQKQLDAEDQSQYQAYLDEEDRKWQATPTPSSYSDRSDLEELEEVELREELLAEMEAESACSYSPNRFRG